MKRKMILKKLNKIKEEHLIHLTPKKSKKGRSYKGTFEVSSHLELMCLITNLLKVCILALEENECVDNEQILQPNYNVNEVLRHILQLIPFQEQEFIDQVVGLLENLNAPLEENTSNI
ncbi:hypothetical protein [Gillisia sp. Hel_I_29]|uniref:hypothetical protein n=1 Tax=Gillisia sp. Hel_I_29 TaxID=1249975 RepID=UPI00068E15F7|nr:hypothetical protein [Gillisia sp. Hel_I_29]